MLYAPSNVKIEPAQFSRIYSGMLALIPTNSRSFITSKFREDIINEIWSREQCLWVFLLKEKKAAFWDFFVAEPDHLKFEHETTQTKIKAEKFIEEQKDK